MLLVLAPRERVQVPQVAARSVPVRAMPRVLQSVFPQPLAPQVPVQLGPEPRVLVRRAEVLALPGPVLQGRHRLSSIIHLPPMVEVWFPAEELAPVPG